MDVKYIITKVNKYGEFKNAICTFHGVASHELQMTIKLSNYPLIFPFSKAMNKVKQVIRLVHYKLTPN